MAYISYPPQPQLEEKKPNHGRKILLTLIVLILVLCAGFGGAVVGGYFVYQSILTQTSEVKPEATLVPVVVQTGLTTQPQSKILITSTEIETTITKVVDAVGPAVVTVLANLPDRRSGFRVISGGTSSGSGVIFSTEGYILTNNHVVEGADRYKVVLANGLEKEAQLVGTDAYADLAVLKVDGDLPAVASLGNSNLLKRGESVIAIGSPLGDFKNSVTVGVVSATGRSLDSGQGYSMEGLIQTDAAINQGNSGGPLLNLAGQVIGINTLIVRNSGNSTVVEGLGFAIPSTTAQVVAKNLIEKGFVTRPYVGATTQSIDPTLARRYSLPVQWGAYITKIDGGSPAEKAGFREGDIIIQVGSTPLDDQRLYLNVLFGYSPGEAIQFTVMRGQQKLEVKVTPVSSTR